MFTQIRPFGTNMCPFEPMRGNEGTIWATLSHFDEVGEFFLKKFGHSGANRPI